MNLQGKRYAILSFDTESDIGSWTQDYTSIDLAMPKLLDLLDEKKVKATFVWEGMAALHNPQMVKETARRGHECGCHTLKHETIGTPAYFIPGDRAILNEEFRTRLKENKEIVRRYSGQTPLSFRAPRLWTDAASLRCIEDCGLLYDSSYAISSDEDPLFPYYPSYDNIAKPGTSKVLQIPVPYLTESMLENADPTLRFFANEMTGGYKNLGQWPILRLYGGEIFCRFFDAFSKKQEEQRGYSLVCIYQHPWEYIPVPGILECPEATTHLRRTLYENSGDFTLNALADFIDGMRKRGYIFLTMAEAGKIFSEANQA